MIGCAVIDRLRVVANQPLDIFLHRLVSRFGGPCLQFRAKLIGNIDAQSSHGAPDFTRRPQPTSRAAAVSASSFPFNALSHQSAEQRQGGAPGARPPRLESNSTRSATGLSC